MNDIRRRSRRVARLLRLSFELLTAHKLRTALSISGLCVGTATVIVMAAAGKGAERRIVERVRAMGSDVLIVTAAPTPRIVGRQRQVSTLTALRTDDATSIARESALVGATAPMVSRVLTARWEDRNTSVPVFGTTAAGLRIRRIRVATGRSFDELEDSERRRVAMVGPTVVRSLFQGADAIGREIRIGAAPFEVIGVIAARGTDVQGTDLDNEIVIPLQTAMRRLLSIPFVHMILVQALNGKQVDDVERDVRSILERLHPTRAGEGTLQPFVIQNHAVLLRTHRGAARAMNRMTVAIAALALLVGGIGIVAVMLLSVRERTREIGLRRAVGARRRDISIQFLLESAVLAVAGSASGILAGFLLAAIVIASGAWDLAFPWGAAVAALLLSIVVGISAGAIPAERAARLEPTIALRSV